MDKLLEHLNASQAKHGHLCPHQVLGVRVGLAGLSLLGLDAINSPKSLLVVVETYGCFVDGIEATAKVSVGQRSLRIEDYGKFAATFVHLKSGHAVRLFPKPGVQELAKKFTHDPQRAYFVQLIGYQIIPDEELLEIEPVALTRSLKAIIDLPQQKIRCSVCGEEINNGRQAWGDDRPTCMACAGYAYYRSLQELPELHSAA
jgi:formylmethanofuran dehydrogenase subunit E